MSRQQPRSVTLAILTLMGVVVLSGLTAVLTLLLRDQLVRAWAEGRPPARRILEQGGLAALDRSSLDVPAFGPPAVVLFVVFAVLAGVLVMFFREGHGWARLALSVLVVFMAVGSCAGLLTGPPSLFLVLAALLIVLNLALLALLWHPDTSAFIRVGWSSDPGSRDSTPASS